jgi:hypothetical protein|tara:strand:- start:44592 stop:45749 length:1158 start_codon:yes stop_codon:yes gene_type:complete
MANYLDILRQFQDAKRVTDPQYKPINPYTSAAYTFSSAKDLYQQGMQTSLQSEEAEGYIPQSVYQKPTKADKITQGVVSATQAGQIESKVSPLLKNIGSKIPTTTVDGVTTSKLFGKKLTADAAGNVTGQFGLNTGSSALISSLAYSIANDNNPYTYGNKEALGMGVGDYMAASTASTALGFAAPWLPIAAAGLGYLFRKRRSKKLKRKEKQIQTEGTEFYTQNLMEERRKRDYFTSEQYMDKPENIYGGNLAASGMKYRYNTGGKRIGDVIAEFTGNELIVNNQNIVEEGLKEKNYSKAAAPIREAMRGGKITPGPETHKDNPMPVTNDGTIYAGGGPLSFRVDNGAGIYDHATDQFKPTMSDRQIANIAQRNINKWKSNNMYS